MSSQILVLVFLISGFNNFGSIHCWQPLIPLNSTFVYPKENYTLFSSSIDPIAEPNSDSIRGYGFGGYDDDDRYVYSHSVATVGNSLDLNNLLGILSLAGLLGTALFALLQTRNGSRAFSYGPFDFLERNDLELDFPLPAFFNTARDFLRRSIWGSEPSPVSLDSNQDLNETLEQGDLDY